MTTPTSTSTCAARTIELGDGLTITYQEHGNAAAAGGGVLLLHGGAGTRSVAGFAAPLSEHAYVITPTHPGFDGQPRPEWFGSIADLATAYLDLLDVLGLREVMVIGSSIGGWIASEMALRDNHQRIGPLVLLNAVGPQPANPADIVDVSVLSPAEISRLSICNPALRPDPAQLTDQQRAGMAANQRTLAVYAGTYMYDPELGRRLHRVTQPVLVAWGEADGVVAAEYGRAYAAAFPEGRFQLIPEAGHLPQLEQPARTLEAIRQFVSGD